MLSILDWTILIGTLSFIVLYGMWQSRGHDHNLQEYLRGGNEAKWWTVGLSVMATQASAITFLSTPGQGYADGLRFVQIYFGLPLAMIVICTTFIPIYHKLKVYTAYEFLEKRFDLKTRILTSFLFLIQRGIAAGITIYAPAIILSSILGWKLNVTCLIIGVMVIIYTVMGGTKAVNATHKMQMMVIMGGMFAVFYLLIDYLPAGVGLGDAIHFASQNGKTQSIDFRFDPHNRYNIWSGIIGGFFLSLSYFGTDQSQVQRYLSGQSVRASQIGLIFNAILKIPMQYFILFVGVMVFVFYQSHASPIFFNEAQLQTVRTAETTGKEFSALEQAYEINQEAKIKAATNALGGDDQALDLFYIHLAREKEYRASTKELISRADPSIETNDKDYVFINFILRHLPKGIIGLLLAMIFSAAMSSTAAELNALATTTTVDIHRRLIHHGDMPEDRAVRIGKLWTLFWGVLAIIISVNGNLLENLIQFVNIIGSLFYGTILGIFLVAFYLKKIGGTAVFIAALIAELLVLALYWQTSIGFLWFNLIGCLAVIAIAFPLSYILQTKHHTES